MEFIGRYDISFRCDILPENFPFPQSGKNLKELMSLKKVGNLTDLNEKGFLSGSRLYLTGKKWPPNSIAENKLNKSQNTGYTGLVYSAESPNLHTKNAAIKINTRNRYIIQNKASVTFRMLTNQDLGVGHPAQNNNLLHQVVGRILVEVPYKHHMKLKIKIRSGVTGPCIGILTLLRVMIPSPVFAGAPWFRNGWSAESIPCHKSAFICMI